MRRRSASGSRSGRCWAASWAGSAGADRSSGAPRRWASGSSGSRAPSPPPPPREELISLIEPLRALRHRATRGSGLTAVFYNFGFFTLLGYAPFPLHLSIHDLGYTFTGWGLMLALFAVFGAPRLARRFGDIRSLGGALTGIVIVLLVMGVAHASQATLIVCVIVSGTFLGVTNTLMTQVVMQSATVPRPIASSAYSCVRF